MEPENIDWSNIESIFVEDETYEGFKAPKWVDLSVSDELIDDEAWFCNPGKNPHFSCKETKGKENFNLLYLVRKCVSFYISLCGLQIASIQSRLKISSNQHVV